ncbi:MAG: MMPL family transporter, partial [Methylococcales bacterium]|nr:MMPL family transporter [Methylococcales bacterium]
TQFHLMREGMSKKDAVLESLRINFKPIFLTSVTTVIGFLSMNFSDAPPFRDLGNMVAIGVTLAFILTVILLPALIVLLPIRKKAGSEASRVIMGCLADLVIRYRRVLLVINTVLAVVLICFAPQNELNDEFVKYFDETVEFRQATEFLTENMGGIYSIEVVVESGDEGGINEPAYLLAVADLVDWFHKQSEVVHVNTLVDTYKRLSKNMHGDNDAWFILPDERNLAAQYLLLYEMSLPYGLDLNNQVNINKSGSRLIVSLKDLSSNQMLAFEQRTRLWVETHLPIYSVEATSPTLMFSHIGKRNSIRMMGGTFCALILISMILMIAFKSIRLGLVSLVPNLIPAGVAFGLWYFIDGRIGLGLSVVTGLTLGIVVDDTVHFMSKYRFARQERQMSQEDAVRYAFSTVGVALWITSVVLVSGFVILTLSHFTMNSTMGFMTAMTITVALVMDLLFLPPLLMRMGK